MCWYVFHCIICIISDNMFYNSRHDSSQITDKEKQSLPEIKQINKQIP